MKAVVPWLGVMLLTALAASLAQAGDELVQHYAHRI